MGGIKSRASDVHVAVSGVSPVKTIGVRFIMECICVQAAQYLFDYRIRLTFNTGEVGDVDLSETIQRYPIARPLLDVKAFSNFRLDDWPTLAWDCGFDIAPEALYRKAGFGASSAEDYSNVAEDGTVYMKTP